VAGRGRSRDEAGHEQDRRACAAELRGALGPEVPIVYLRADMCRSDLLVEIEAVGHCRHAPEG
jgi:hypothetical protein